MCYCGYIKTPYFEKKLWYCFPQWMRRSTLLLRHFRPLHPGRPQCAWAFYFQTSKPSVLRGGGSCTTPSKDFSVQFTTFS